VRAILLLTCTGVSFAHGSNDGQKGMGLIMLILVGSVPAAYALNHAMNASDIQTFVAISERACHVLEKHQRPGANVPAQPRPVLERLVSNRGLAADSIPALRATAMTISAQVSPYHSLSRMPTQLSGNVRNDMYLAGESLRVVLDRHLLDLRPDEEAALRNYHGQLDRATKFIPTWVKVAVALALGLGTMVGWKRIVVTVGERIGDRHLTYAQGACSEMVAMGTILAADRFGLPVSTTHVLTSGVAGTMAANRCGLQWGTVRNLAMAWLMTLPASIILSASLFWAFRQVL
jgi:PiT family inorganic phosphate transporter